MYRVFNSKSTLQLHRYLHHCQVQLIRSSYLYSQRMLSSGIPFPQTESIPDLLLTHRHRSQTLPDPPLQQDSPMPLQDIVRIHPQCELQVHLPLLLHQTHLWHLVLHEAQSLHVPHSRPFLPALQFQLQMRTVPDIHPHPQASSSSRFTQICPISPPAPWCPTII